MKIAIIGTGAMACLFAARLNAVADVILVGTWREQIDALNQNGLLLHELDGGQTQHFVMATDAPEQIAPADVVLVLTKSYQTIEAVERVARVLTPDGTVVTLQNGLGNLEILADAFGRNRCTVGVTAQGATMLRPGHVRHAGNGVTHLAIPADLPKVARQLAQKLTEARIPLNIVASADSLLWSKVAINAGINPLTALYDVPNGVLATDPMLRPMMLAAAEEVAAVAEAFNVTLTYESVSTEVERIALATATNRSSMLQDVTRGAPTEIDAICGAAARFGRIAAVPTPMNTLLYQAIINLESGADRQNLIHQLQLGINSLQ